MVRSQWPEVDSLEARSWAVDVTWLGLAKQLLGLLQTWHGRSRQRLALSQLDAERLADIGVSRDQAERELKKWFWQV